MALSKVGEGIMLQSLVLPQDMKSAKALYECCYSCLNRAQLELKRENLDEADRWITEFQRCKRDLDKLIQKKIHCEKLIQLAADLKSKGINISFIEKNRPLLQQ